MDNREDREKKRDKIKTERKRDETERKRGIRDKMDIGVKEKKIHERH